MYHKHFRWPGFVCTVIFLTRLCRMKNTMRGVVHDIFGSSRAHEVVIYANKNAPKRTASGYTFVFRLLGVLFVERL